MSAPMTPDREQEIRETHPGSWYDGPWTQDFVESNGENCAYNRVLHSESGTTLATLPDFAGSIALFIADAHDAVPELLAEVDRLRARIAELEAQAEKVASFCGKRAEYVTNLRDCNPNADHDYYRWTGHAEARRQLSQSLGLPVAWPAEDRIVPAESDDPRPGGAS